MAEMYKTASCLTKKIVENHIKFSSPICNIFSVGVNTPKFSMASVLKKETNCKCCVFNFFLFLLFLVNRQELKTGNQSTLPGGESLRLQVM